MTLLEIFPSLRSGMPSPRLATSVWPCETHYDDLGRITVAGVALADIADQYGTPTYVLDETEVRRRCQAYRKHFPDAEIIYAAKALMTKSMARWVTEEGLSVDVCSAGELAIALAAGVDPERIVLHGSGKPFAELEAAVAAGVGRIVLDSLTEVTLLSALATRPQKVLLRLSPDIDVHGHPAVKTGVLDQKFGFPIGSAQAAEAVERILRQPTLRLVGFHCHLGSQISNPDYYGEGVRRMVAEMARVHREHGHLMTELDLGGGHAVAYRCGDPEMNLPELADIVEDALDAACARHHFPRPHIAMEPGRAIAARAGVTLYRVMTIKHIEGGRTFVIVDGGMNDNPRVALYGARYDAVVANRHPTGAHMTATVAGRYCEAGDILAHDVSLPADLRPGEVLAIPCTGAYHHSLASSYNGVGRPPIVAVHEGRCQQILRRETPADLLSRDLG
ncbi:diaminopimelate decarboxylase [Nocardia terpenica]|uniref:Diaminopimelate decarboxylase n=1 Tax=Nocardia terpenica TaxID=455432 RepID=A0A164PIL2_9NOCA|nr:diaminopimelate decarboxylase [Nocardia terpenica]KZM75618.1 diaminopimelate decarboxylase [Nocardia terpenica]MBF6064760.1 diaminopimelate decarboxylase [Nocardia terpenica]MBF6107275.1 diaminopimelate decarboxylase [Nocardia terpenica]MBF6115032.1 diaminopimelate decarboxylase [Nocardia terpenica]MBF6122138.1 diaminopimelate decarboxylase [Nocardia terpenica]